MCLSFIRLNSVFSIIIILTFISCKSEETKSKLLEKAIGLENSKQYAQGLEVINKAIELYEESSQMLVIKGRFLSYLNKDTDAIVVFKRAIELDKSNTSAYYNLGITYDLLNRRDSSLAYFNMALKSKSKGSFIFEQNTDAPITVELKTDIPEVAIRYQRAIVQYDLHLLDKAAEDLQYCINLNYEKAACMMYLGVIYIYNGDKKGCQLLKEAMLINEPRAEKYFSEYCKEL